MMILSDALPLATLLISMINTALITYASAFSVTIPLLLYLSRIRSLSKAGHSIGVLVIISGLLDAAGWFLSSRKISTVLVSNIYGFLLFSILCWFYYELFIKKSNNHNYRIVLFTGIAAYVICLFIVLATQGLFQYQDLLRAFSGIIILVLSISFFHYLFKSGPATTLKLYQALWFAMGIVFYFAASIGVFICFQYLLTQTTPDVVQVLWSVHNVNNIIKNILFALGFYYVGR
jgi:hypothetical protein